MGEFQHKVDDFVRWTFAVRGNPVHKTGKVLARVHARTGLASVVKALGYDLRDLGLVSAVDQAQADRYLVEVSVPHKTKGRTTKKYYVPLASNIDKQMARAAKETPKRARKGTR